MEAVLFTQRSWIQGTEFSQINLLKFDKNLSAQMQYIELYSPRNLPRPRWNVDGVICD